MKTKLSKQEILERVGTMAQLAGIRPYIWARRNEPWHC